MKGGGLQQGVMPMPNFRTTESFGKLPSPADVANAVRGSEGIAISVAADVDNSGNIIPLVTDVARQESQKITTQGIKEYNRTMPDRIKQVNQQPRKR